MFHTVKLQMNRRYICRIACTIVLVLCGSLAICGSIVAYETEECLVCHKDYGRKKETMPEGVANLYLDEDAWKKDVHAAVAGLACDDCHIDAAPETHPPQGLQRVNCAECHEDQAAAYYNTVHWTAPVAEGRRKPDCADCHQPHATRHKQDPESSVYKGKVKEICFSCHRDKEVSFSLPGRLLLFRTSAHRKSDLSNAFDRTECVNCHFAQAVGHGNDPLRETHCARCHSDSAGVEKMAFGPFHLDPSLKHRPMVMMAQVINIFIFLALLAALVFWLVRGFTRPGDGTTAHEPGG